MNAMESDLISVILPVRDRLDPLPELVRPADTHGGPVGGSLPLAG